MRCCVRKAEGFIPTQFLKEAFYCNSGDARDKYFHSATAPALQLSRLSDWLFKAIDGMQEQNEALNRNTKCKMCRFPDSLIYITILELHFYYVFLALPMHECF